ncbi:MAG TPA: hypothetical protein VLA34_11805, partial [Candidatus Krumholzibacterium sp.]|nr:hypothetical protein [Candidatus Krumholzibacterium sp.]
MFFDIFRFELRYRLRRPLTWVWLVIYGLFGFMGVSRASIGRGLLASMTSAGRGNIQADAPYGLYLYVTILSAFGLMVAASWFGDAASRDFRLGTHTLFFSWPVKKASYLGGRFAGAIAAVLIVLSGISLGGLLAAASPLVDRSGIGTMNL